MMMKKPFKAQAVVLSKQPEPVVSVVRIVETHGMLAVAEIDGKRYAAAYNDETEMYEVNDVGGLLEPGFTLDDMTKSPANIRIVVQGVGSDTPPDVMATIQEMLNKLEL